MLTFEFSNTFEKRVFMRRGFHKSNHFSTLNFVQINCMN